MPQISTRSAAETSIHGRRLCDRERDELDLDRLDRELLRERDELDRERLLVLRRLEERLLLERVEGVRLIVLRLAIAQMFSLMALLYHSRDESTRQT
jgi:hypothetical protein